MKTKRSLAVLCAIGLFAASYAQTNPAAVSLPFSLSSQSTTTLPSGVAVHRFTSIPTSRTLSPATGDLPNQGNSPTGTAGGWYDLGTDGIGLLSSGTNPAGAIIVAINTTGLTNISVSWICKTIKNQASRDNSIALQYRVGTTGNFIDAGTTSTYASTGMADGNTSSVFTETLPAGANNQAVVQVRWIYWESVSTSGSRDKISVDNISISGSSGSSCGAPTGLTASGITAFGANLNWSSGAGSVSYEYALSTSPTPPASGTSIATTAYIASGLTSGTSYYFHLRSFCSGALFSSWTSVNFTTGTESTTDSSEITIMTYNLLNYPGSNASSREPDYRIIVDSVMPDVMVVQELSSPSGISSFLSNVLNFSSSAYSQGTFIDGPDSDNGIYYKSAKFQFISNTPIHTDLRDISQFKLKYTPTGDTMIFYSAHLKADNTSGDAATRGDEIDSLRKVTNTLSAGKYFMVCGDFNIYGSTEAAYQNLVNTGLNVNGKFNDVLSMTGTWNNSAYAINHTQSPRTTSFGGGATGGLDDRFDMILFSNAITNPGGLDVVSGSYTAFGNDGNHYNLALNTPPYTLYSSTVAAALHDASDHLPVVVKLKYSSGSGARTTGIAAITKTFGNNISIYPNPAHTAFIVKTNTNFNVPVMLHLSDATGRILKQVEINIDYNEARFDVSGFAPGVYYLGSKQLNAVYKVIIE